MVIFAVINHKLFIEKCGNTKEQYLENTEGALRRAISMFQGMFSLSTRVRALSCCQFKWDPIFFLLDHSQRFKAFFIVDKSTFKEVDNDMIFIFIYSETSYKKKSYLLSSWNNGKKKCINLKFIDCHALENVYLCIQR